jgi:hypothetical protein
MRRAEPPVRCMANPAPTAFVELPQVLVSRDALHATQNLHLAFKAGYGMLRGDQVYRAKSIASEGLELNSSAKRGRGPVDCQQSDCPFTISHWKTR